MTENPRPDRKTQINKCIRYFAQQKRPLEIFEAYEEMYKLMEADNLDRMDYVDFEWKYYQFYHGNQDLTIERSPDNSSKVTFSDLPVHVLEKVVGESGLSACMALRKVSRNLRRLVDSAELHCDRLYFHYGDRSSTIEIDYRVNLVFDHVKGGRCKIATRRYGKKKEYRDGRNFEEAMTAEFSTFLRNPKLKIRRFEFTFSENEACFHFMASLASLGFKLNVRSVDINTDDDDVLPILECLKPRVLEEISFDADEMTVEQFDEIAETEQWKGARKLCIDRFPTAVGIGMEKMVHFKEIRITDIEFSDENLAMVRDVLLKSAHIESCWLGVADFEEHFGDWDDDEDWEDVEDEVEEESVVRIMAQDSAFNAETLRFAVPNSRDHFQLEFEKDFRLMIYALKITRNKEE